MIGFVGADPAGLSGLAEISDQYAVRLVAIVDDTERIQIQHRRRGAATGPVVVLRSVESGLREDATQLRWRADAIEQAQDITIFGLVGNYGVVNRALFASLAVFDLADWAEAYRAWSHPPQPNELAAMEPAQVAAVFAGLQPYQAQLLLTAHPELIGGLDGVPPEARYEANRLLIEREIGRLEEQIGELLNEEPGERSRWIGIDRIISWFTVSSLRDTAAAALRQRRDEYRHWLDEERQILLFDPGGDGRAVEVFGDLTAAARVAVVVPGMSNDIGNFSDDAGGFRANAERLYRTSSGLADVPIATIAWLGYDPPDGVDAATTSAARQGASRLDRFLEGIDVAATKGVTVIAHSYGSVVAGIAVREGLEANDLVFVGSPGTTLAGADDALLRPGGRVWSALAQGDPIGVGVSPAELPPWWVPVAFAPSWLLVDLSHGGAEELWHGANPASDEFGARRITTDGSSGHSSYFEAGTLLNLARIVQGLYAEVELAN